MTDALLSKQARAAAPPCVELFLAEEMAVNPARLLAPGITHAVVDPAPFRHEKLPRLLASDPQAKYLGARPGDVVRVVADGGVVHRRVA